MSKTKRRAQALNRTRFVQSFTDPQPVLLMRGGQYVLTAEPGAGKSTWDRRDVTITPSVFGVGRSTVSTVEATITTSWVVDDD